MKKNKLIINGKSLTLEKIEHFLNENPDIVISKESVTKINKSRTLVEKWVNEGEVVYGITTGFGEFSNVNISKKDLRTLQENLIFSHALAAVKIFLRKL